MEVAEVLRIKERRKEKGEREMKRLRDLETKRQIRKKKRTGKIILKKRCQKY